MPIVTCNVHWCLFNDSGYCKNEEDEIILTSSGGAVFRREVGVDCGFKPKRGWYRQSDGTYIKEKR